MPDTFTLADGTVINTATGRKVVTGDDGDAAMIRVPTSFDAIEEVTRVRRRVADLPAAPAEMNAVSLVAMYHMYGLNDYDIAFVTKLSEAQVTAIRQSDVYTSLLVETQRRIIAEVNDGVRGLFEKNANGAAQRVITLMNSDDEKIQMAAAKDVLDRAGHRPNDVVEHRHKVEGGLRIEYVRKNIEAHTPTIDITDYEDVDIGDGIGDDDDDHDHSVHSDTHWEN